MSITKQLIITINFLLNGLIGSYDFYAILILNHYNVNLKTKTLNYLMKYRVNVTQSCHKISHGLFQLYNITKWHWNLLDCEVWINFIALRSKCQELNCSKFFLCNGWQVYPYYIFNPFIFRVFFFFWECGSNWEVIFREFHHYDSSRSFWLMDCWVLMHSIDVGITLIAKQR